MTTDVMFAPYKSRVVSSGGLLRPLTYLPGTSVEKKITRPGRVGPAITVSRIIAARAKSVWRLDDALQYQLRHLAV